MEQISLNESAMDSNQLLTEKTVAKLLSVGIRTIQKWRQTGNGPQYVCISKRCVRYRYGDVMEWIKNGLKKSTSEQKLLLG